MAGKFGEADYGAWFYGGGIDKKTFVASTIEVYDSAGTFKTFFQTGSGDFLGVEFVIDESGGRDFTLFFADFVSIEKKDQIKIRVFDNPDYFFTGVIRTIPIDGSTKLEFNYTGYGFTDYLLRTNTESQTYSAKTVNFIVNDLIDNIIVSNTPIVKNATKIDTLNITVSSIEFDYINCKEAFDQLKDIANSDGNDYLYGVDGEGEFFFKARDTDTKVELIAGKRARYGIINYEPFDTFEAVTKLYVKKKDGTFYKTFTSTEGNDIFELKLTAPDIADADIDNWANGQLLIKEKNTRESSITWPIENYSPLYLKADGRIQIISNIPPKVQTAATGSKYGTGKYGAGKYGGSQYAGKDLNDLLNIKEVRYTIKDVSAVRNIQLGSLPIELDRQILKVNKNIQDLRVSLGR